MKKVLIVLLILAVFGGGLFAQELTWSGVAESGLRFSGNKDDGGRMDVWNDNDGVVSRARVQAAYEADNYGVKVGIGTDFSTSMTVPNIGTFTFPGDSTIYAYNAYGWYTLLDKITFRAGLIDDGVWNTMGPDDWNVSNGLGVRLEITPVEGFNIGFLLTTPSDTVDSTLGDFFKESAIGFSYGNDSFDFALAYKLDSDADGSNDTDHTALLGFVFKGVPALTAKVEAKGEELGAWDTRGLVTANEELAYQVTDPLKVGVVLTEKISGNSTTKLFFKAKPYVEFQVNEPVSVGLEVPLWFQKDVTKLGLGGKPWIKYALTDNAYFKLFYAMDYEKPDPAGDATLKHTVQLDFVAKF